MEPNRLSLACGLRLRIPMALHNEVRTEQLAASAEFEVEAAVETAHEEGRKPVQSVPVRALS